MKVMLVSCSGQKLRLAAPARELYCGPLFRLSLRWAERQGATYVVSAQHRLVQLDDVIEPYNLRLAQLSRPARVAWGWAILETLRGLHPQLRELVLLAGAEYATWLQPPLEWGWQVQEPLRGMGIGQRLTWLQQMLNEPVPQPQVQLQLGFTAPQEDWLAAHMDRVRRHLANAPLEEENDDDPHGADSE